MEETTTVEREEQPVSKGTEALRMGHSGRRRRSSGHRRRTLRQLLPLIAGGAIGFFALLMLSLYLFGALARYSSENSLQQAKLEKGETELRDARADVKRIRVEMDALVKQRMPHLKPLEFDKVIPVNQGYVRNVLFTETHSDNKTTYEYKIVLENIDSPPAVPEIRVLLFDRTGVQVGGALVNGIKMMRPGDRDSFGSDVDIFIDAKPEYFYIYSKTT
jgi:hypothetical protein